MNPYLFDFLRNNFRCGRMLWTVGMAGGFTAPTVHHCT